MECGCIMGGIWMEYGGWVEYQLYGWGMGGLWIKYGWSMGGLWVSYGLYWWDMGGIRVEWSGQNDQYLKKWKI